MVIQNTVHDTDDTEIKSHFSKIRITTTDCAEVLLKSNATTSPTACSMSYSFAACRM